MTVINWPAYRKWKAGATTFSGLNELERRTLKQWALANPHCLHEDFLIFQPNLTYINEVHDRFHLIAFDRAGNLVTIVFNFSNHLNDSLWHGLKLAGLYSVWPWDNVLSNYQEHLKSVGSKVSARVALNHFIGSEDFNWKLNVGNTQRVVIVSEAFDLFETIPLEWLKSYGISINCLKVTPFKNDDNLSLRTEKFEIDKLQLNINVKEI